MFLSCPAIGVETGTGPVDVAAMDDENLKETEFDWDRELPVSDRARQALEFMSVAMEKYGNAYRPLRPVAPSSVCCSCADQQSFQINSAVSPQPYSSQQKHFEYVSRPISNLQKIQRAILSVPSTTACFPCQLGPCKLAGPGGGHGH